MSDTQGKEEGGNKCSEKTENSIKTSSKENSTNNTNDQIANEFESD